MKYRKEETEQSQLLRGLTNEVELATDYQPLDPLNEKSGPKYVNANIPMSQILFGLRVMRRNNLEL
jgi:hypothetical protein